MVLTAAMSGMKWGTLTFELKIPLDLKLLHVCFSNLLFLWTVTISDNDEHYHVIPQTGPIL